MHFRRFIVACSVLAILVLAAGCGAKVKKQEIQNKVPLVKVHGIVKVNGKPRKDVLVVLVPQKPLAEKRKEYLTLTGETNDNGEFSFNTYEPFDGVPVGEYGILARWKVSKMIASRGRPEIVDQFEGKYFNKDSPIKKFSATDSEVDLGVIDLQGTEPQNSK